MKVAIVTNQAPFVRGGAELLAEWLQAELERRGHDTVVVRIPFRWFPPERVLDHILSARLLEIPKADRVIAMKFPAYLVPHHSKVLWLLHQFRQAYDLWNSPHQELTDTPSGRRIRDAVTAADNAFLPEAEAIFTNSRVTTARLKQFNGLDSRVLYPPLVDPAGFRSDPPGDYVFAPSRLSTIKRQALLVEAMAHVRTPVRLVLAGPPDEPQQLRSLEQRIDELGLGERVELQGRWISEADKRELYAGALATAYVPYDEDSYGYVTLESFHARKPVVTCTDSGGTHELVEDGVTGFVVAPQPEQLAEAFDRLYDDRDAARALGEAAHAKLAELEISWDRVVERLLA
jgi:glycosyltransferase involved in cell wall biosynthesis